MAPNQTTDSIQDKRRQHVGPNVAISYEQPLHMVRGEKCYLYDNNGREYLDCVNNVAHVGHAHPKVVAAMCDQLKLVNTNCRYLHGGLPELAHRLTATMPEALQKVYFVCSGSEANDLALRIAHSAVLPDSTDTMHIAVMDGAYHGHVSSMIDCSPYKFMNPGGAGKPPHIHVLPFPDVYRGKHLDGRAAARTALQSARDAGARIGAFICESVMSCAGQVVFPEGYLKGVYEEMKGAGVVCIADEVQCGFGRVGEAFWGFQLQDVVPDIVTLGKPIGNGFPMAALVTTAQLASSFNNGMEYFSTFGGCTAAMATGLAVLSVIFEEDLQGNAARVGTALIERLRELQKAYPDVIGDVRGVGFMIGIEFVTDDVTKAEAPAIAKWVKEMAREEGVLLTTDGMLENVIKIKPPMCFGMQDVERLMAVLYKVFATKLTAPIKSDLIRASNEFVAQRRALWKSLAVKSSSASAGHANGMANGTANGTAHL